MTDSVTQKLASVFEATQVPVREQLDIGLYLSAILISLAAAFVASLMYRFFYERRGTGSQVHRAFPLLAVSITTLFVGIQVSLALSLGLLGSLSIIRFRTPIKEPEEVGFIMLVIAASISAATYNFILIPIMYVVALVALFVMRGAALLRWMKRDGLIVMTLPKEIAMEKFREIDVFLGESTEKHILESTATHAGSTTYQFAISGFEKNVGEIESGLSKIADFTQVNIFLDRPGGIR